MPKNGSVLVITIGTSDIQAVDGYPESPERLRLHRDSVRDFHEACLNGEVDYEVLPLEETPGLPEVGQSAEYDPERRLLSTGLSEKTDKHVRIDCRRRVTLCCPIVADVLEAVQQRRRRVGAVVKVLLLTTRRTGGRFARQEPVAAHAVLRPVLAQALSLDPEDVVECVFLQGEEELYEEDGVGEQHLCRAAARRIDHAIQQLHSEHPDATLIVSDVGGIPEVKAVLAASARYRFGDRLLFLRRGEGEGRRIRQRRSISPAESLTTRRQIKQLIHTGAIDAAARLAVAVPDQVCRDVEPWRSWLWALGRLLAGDESAVDPQAVQKWPAGSRMRAWVSNSSSRNPALLAALRVEFSLQSEDWSAALRETFVFFEAVRLEVIRAKLSQPRGPRCVDAAARTFYPQRVREEFREKLPVEWLNNESLPLGGERGHKKNVLTRLVERFGDELESIAVLERAVANLRGLRNKATHSILTEHDVSRVRELATRSHDESGASCEPLWSRRPPHFVAHSAVRASLKDLGVRNPVDVYQGLIEAIEHDMDTFSFQDDR